MSRRPVDINILASISSVEILRIHRSSKDTKRVLTIATMKFLLTALLAVTASAHYTFPALIAGGSSTSDWQYVRKTTNFQSNGPVTDVKSNQIRCYELSPGTGAQTYTVKAGDNVGFVAKSSISHPGPLQFYMAKVPSGKTAADWDGSGNVWFKVCQPRSLLPNHAVES